jgi:Na+-translocating ferredoxin:NAD+ oxidoreductase subunit B
MKLEDSMSDQSPYELLATHLEKLPGGFARTASGVELRILNRLFTPDEAWVAAHTSVLPESLKVVAFRSHLSVPKTKEILDCLVEKRLISNFQVHGKTQYMAQQFVVGFWEGQVDHLTRDLVEEFEEYFPAYADTGLWGKSPQLRVIPVKKSISLQSRVMPYEQVTSILDEHKGFAVANCICRQEQQLLGHDCGKPLETCLAFDGAVEYFIQTGRGREISREEAGALIDLAEKTGLVLQPGNTRNPGNICMCCGDCCGVLRSIKRMPKPANEVATDYYAVLDAKLCNGCKVCLKRCQMEALAITDGKACLDRDRCIGCGLCVSTCKTGALSLVRKAESDLPQLPANDIMLGIRMAQTHGQLGWGQILGILIRSGVDRIRAEFAFRNYNSS